MEQVTLQLIQTAINEERWDEAKAYVMILKTMDSEKCKSDIFAVLEASCYIHDGAYPDALDCIYRGLKVNIYNYELYYMLGNIKEALGNHAQALFSYENAALYAKGEDKSFLEEYLKEYRTRQKCLPGKVAIVLVNYQNLQYTKLCVDSIELEGMHYPNSYEIIVIDNHSDDGTKEWLEQSHYKYIINDDNKGFPAACNQGIALADKDSDVFLLNNDTVLMPNSIYCLRMGLYEDKQNGITGSVSNYVSNDQKIDQSFDTLEEYISYSAAHNVYSSSQQELRLKLVGFAMMFKRSVLDQIGVLDEAYGLGHYEDDDISIRCLKAGYHIVLCKDSFIYHYGNRSFYKKKQEDMNAHHEMIKKNYLYFIHKWGVDLNYYSHIRTEIVDIIQDSREKRLRILEIGCGCGATLLCIKSRFPNAEIYGVELEKAVTEIVEQVIPIECQNIEDQELSYPMHSFDYIILGDVLEHLHNPADILCYLKQFLSKNGCIIASIPNVMNHTVVLPLLKGKFEYREAGILDRTHLRFFTLDSILEMFLATGYSITKVCTLQNSISEESKDFIKKLVTLSDDIKEEGFYAYQYLIKADLTNSK